MNRRDFGKGVALKMGLDAVIIDKVIGAMIEDVISQVEKGEKAHWSYFGTWSAADRKQRTRFSLLCSPLLVSVTPAHKVLKLSLSLPLRGRGWMNEAARRYSANQ